MSKSPGYNEAIEEIDAIVEEIENESIDIDLLTEKVKRAALLIKLCKNKLKKTDGEINKILEEFEKADTDE